MREFLRQHGLLLVLAALVLALVIGAGSLLLGGVEGPVGEVFSFLTAPVRGAANAFVDWSEQIYSDRYDRDALREENERLRLELSKLQDKSREYEEAIQENERLRSLLGLRERRRDLELESATVTGWENTNWFSRLTVSKGSSHGVEPGDCVIDQYGNLVGVVAQVGGNYCTVSTLIDAGLELGGLVARTGDAAILEGEFTLMGEGRLKLSYLPQDSELISGDQVLTSGLGGVYPAGLVAGYVDEVRSEASGAERYAVIVPQTDLDSLKQVFIIKSFDIVE